MILKYERGNLIDLEYVMVIDNQLDGVVKRHAGRLDRLFFSVGKGPLQQFDDRKWQVESGDLVYIPRSCAYTDTYPKDRSGYAILAALKTDFVNVPFRISFADNAAIAKLWQRLLHEFEQKGSGWYFRCMQTLYTILGAAFKKMQNDYIGASAAKKIIPVVEYLNSHFHDPNLSIATAAMQCDISYSRFRKMFHDLYGMSAKAYLGGLRIEYAGRLLTESVLSVAKIAEMAGFRDEYYFSAAFKKAVGQSPTAFRNAQTSDRTRPS